MAAAGNTNFDDLLTTTLANHAPKLIDNCFSARPFAHFLKQAGQIKMKGGGHKIVQPLIYAQNGSATVYKDSDTLSPPTNGGLSAAEFNWRQYAVTISITGIEEAKNSSEEEIIDLLEARIMQAEQTIIEQMDTFLIVETGTVGTTGWNALGGTNGLVSQNTNAVGGIATTGGDQAYWQSYLEASAAVLTLAQMATAYNTASEGNDQPNMLLTTQTLYEKYESLLQPQLRFSDAKTVDAGFQNLLYKGAPILFDSNVQTGYMYFLNTKYLSLVGHKDVWFKPTPFVRPSNVDARYAQILCYGNLTVSNRSRQGVLTGKTA